MSTNEYPWVTAETRLLTDAELEQDPAVRLPRQTLKNLRHKESGPPYLKIGRRVLYRRGDVLAWIERHRVTPAA
jgi:hypothetical protein